MNRLARVSVSAGAGSFFDALLNASLQGPNWTVDPRQEFAELAANPAERWVIPSRLQEEVVRTFDEKTYPGGMSAGLIDPRQTISNAPWGRLAAQIAVNDDLGDVAWRVVLYLAAARLGARIRVISRDGAEDFGDPASTVIYLIRSSSGHWDIAVPQRQTYRSPTPAPPSYARYGNSGGGAQAKAAAAMGVGLVTGNRSLLGAIFESAARTGRPITEHGRPITRTDAENLLNRRNVIWNVEGLDPGVIEVFIGQIADQLNLTIAVIAPDGTTQTYGTGQSAYLVIAATGTNGLYQATEPQPSGQNPTPTHHGGAGGSGYGGAGGYQGGAGSWGGNTPVWFVDTTKADTEGSAKARADPAHARINRWLLQHNAPEPATTDRDPALTPVTGWIESSYSDGQDCVSVTTTTR